MRILAVSDQESPFYYDHYAPGRLSGFDHASLTAFLPHELLTVEPPLDELGKCAAEMLIRRIENPGFEGFALWNGSKEYLVNKGSIYFSDSNTSGIYAQYDVRCFGEPYDAAPYIGGNVTAGASRACGAASSTS